MGKPLDPHYWRKWRAAHPEYRAREKARAKGRPRGDRSAEYAKRRRPTVEPLAPLYPELQHGSRLAFWEDELRMDLAQERALAELEGLDPDVAVRRYRSRELAFRATTVPLMPGRDHNWSGPRVPTSPGRQVVACVLCAEDRRILRNARLEVEGVGTFVVKLCGPCIANLPRDPDPLDVSRVA